MEAIFQEDNFLSKYSFLNCSSVSATRLTPLSLSGTLAARNRFKIVALLHPKISAILSLLNPELEYSFITFSMGISFTN